MRCLVHILTVISITGSLLASASAYAVEQYVFSAPPRGSAAAEEKVYEPVARYLSKVLGKKVVYEHPGDWLSYQTNMQKGIYDIIFDGPHFASWRIKRINHEPLAVLPGKLTFNIYTRNDQKRLHSIKDLGGRTVCALAPPNLATLTVYDAFAENPMRQPMVKMVKTFKSGYDDVSKGKCEAGVARDKLFSKLDKSHNMRVIHTSSGIVNQGFTAGPRVSDKDKVKIIQALISPGLQKKINPFHKRFNKSMKKLQPARVVEYEGLDRMLDSSWGFNK